MRTKMTEVGLAARDQVSATTSRLRRLSAGPALVRTVAAVAALVAIVASLPLQWVIEGPPSVFLRLVVGAAVVSVGVGLFPRTRWVSLVASGVIVVWLLSTIAFGEVISLPRVGVLAAAVYLMHVAAAFAAVLPYDCVVSPAVIGRWFAKAGSVLGLSLIVGLGGMTVAGELPAARSVVGPIVGSIVAAGLAGLLAWHLLRRRG